MKASFHLLISTLLAARFDEFQFWPLFLIGGTAVVAIKASNRRSS
jgi:hypothetical protein